MTNDEKLMQQAYAVPLVEQLEAVPKNARLWIDDEDGIGTHHFPIGRMCHEAAEALRARLAQPEPETITYAGNGTAGFSCYLQLTYRNNICSWRIR